MVAGQDEDLVGARLLDEVEVLVYGVGGAPVPVGAFPTQVWLEQGHAASLPVEVPGTADGDVLVQGAGPILGENPHPGNPGVGAVAEGEIDDAVVAAEDHGRFGPLFREDA